LGAGQAPVRGLEFVVALLQLGLAGLALGDVLEDDEVEVDVLAAAAAVADHDLQHHSRGHADLAGPAAAGAGLLPGLGGQQFKQFGGALAGQRAFGQRLGRRVGAQQAPLAVEQDHRVLGGPERPLDSELGVGQCGLAGCRVLAFAHPTPRQRAWGRAPGCPRESYTPVDSTRPRWRRAQPTSRLRRESSTPLAWFCSRSASSRSAAIIPGCAASARRRAASLSAVEASRASTSLSSSARRSASSARSSASSGWSKTSAATALILASELLLEFQHARGHGLASTR